MNYRNLDETIELGTVEQEENELPVLPRRYTFRFFWQNAIAPSSPLINHHDSRSCAVTPIQSPVPPDEDESSVHKPRLLLLFFFFFFFSNNTGHCREHHRRKNSSKFHAWKQNVSRSCASLSWCPASHSYQRARDESLTVRRMRQMWDRINSPRSVFVRVVLKICMFFICFCTGALFLECCLVQVLLVDFCSKHVLLELWRPTVKSRLPF